MIIKASGLGKDFNLNRIFTQFSYTFNSGLSYAITGPNGSGKSTLLMTLAGFITPTKGVLEYFDAENKIDPENWYKYLVLATPYLQLIEEFTLKEFLAFHFKFKPISNGVQLEEIPKKCGLEAHNSVFIKNFSSGMKQRLKLGIGFYSDTPILFLDEPTGNLDASGISWYKNEITGLLEKKLILIASNQPNEYDFCQHTIDLSTLK